jgi:isoquinoline 1-oxidoreductase alpha subunit
MPIHFRVNGKERTVDVEPDMPLLWVLRDVLNLTGTKFGCGIGQCGACTVHLDGEARRSCLLPAQSVADRSVTTIEGLGVGGPHPLQAAWIAEDAPQCGYCQSGMIMAAAAFLKHTPNPTDQAIDEGVTNICRCGTYSRVRKAIKRAASAA